MSLRSKLARLGGWGPSSSDAGQGGAADAPGADGGANPASPTDVLSRLRAQMDALCSESRGAEGSRSAQRARDREELREAEDAWWPFALEETASGPLHRHCRRLGPAHRVGRVELSPAREACAEALALLALDPSIQACLPKHALYIDTETTGLSGGAGTVAFLVGLAFFDDDGRLVQEQVFLKALGEERPMLEHVRGRIEQAQMLVSFNGKAFDLPLLRGRFVLQRMAPPAERPHLDLLHVARRVHGRTARRRQDCRLQTLEQRLLGHVRIDDVAGADVAARYLHYLRAGDPSLVQGVVEHNAWDVLSMVALVALYGAPLTDSPLAGDDLAGMAHTAKRAGRLDTGRALAERAVESGGSEESRKVRAELARAMRDRAAALADYEALDRDVDDARVRLELAKLYEHFARRPDAALAVVDRGVAESDASVAKRRARLLQKVPAKADGGQRPA